MKKQGPLPKVAIMSGNVVQVRVRLEPDIRQVLLMKLPQLRIVESIPFRAAALVVEEDAPAAREQRAKRHLSGDEHLKLNGRDLVAICDHEVDARPVCRRTRSSAHGGWQRLELSCERRT